MKTKLLGITLFTLTLGVVAYYPQIFAKTSKAQPPINYHITANKPVFCLDSMVYASVEGLK